MIGTKKTECIAFEGYRRIASGKLEAVVRQVKAVLDQGEMAPVLIFNATTSDQVEVDFRGTADEVADRLPDSPSEPGVDSAVSGSPLRGPGRPKLGVIAREVTLLPRHWDWLSSQPGGASVALRKLVEEARQSRDVKDRVRIARERAYRFLTSLAGNLPGFEEASRALFAGDAERFASQTADWPRDVREHAGNLAAATFEPSSPEAEEIATD